MEVNPEIKTDNSFTVRILITSELNAEAGLAAPTKL